MNDRIEFGGGYDHRDLPDALHDLARGKLPGRWGLLQELVSHWAIAPKERTWLRLGKATLDSLGSVISYRESRREVVDGGTNPSRRWLHAQGYEEAFPGGNGPLGSFVRSGLAGLEFREQRVRGPLGRLDTVALKGFDLPGGGEAWFLDPQPGQGHKPSTWFGPYCRPDDRPRVEQLLRETVWGRLGSQTATLEVSEEPFGEDRVHLVPVAEELDFVSADETSNDVESLAERCQAFLSHGRSRTFLFHGPPGTGKSTLARALARALEARLVLVASDSVGRLCSGTVLAILELLAPGVVVLNDVDRCGVAEQYALLHGLERRGARAVLTVLTVNDVSLLDPALLRPGRVHEVRRIPEPSRSSRARILGHYVLKLGLRLSADQTAAFLARSEGFSPADVREFCETAQAVGTELALEELSRIASQRELYAGDRWLEPGEDERRGGRGRRWRGRAAAP